MHTLPFTQLFSTTRLVAYPTLFHVGATMFFAFIVSTFLIRITFKILARKVADSCLDKNHFPSMLDNNGANILSLIYEKL